MHLREAGVECVMLTGTSSKQEQNDAFNRMTTHGQGGQRKKIKVSHEIKHHRFSTERLIHLRRL
jgi:hypothetical protein